VTVTRRSALAALPVLLAAGLARGDSLAQQVQAALAAPGDPVQAGVWFGPASHEPRYQLAADRAIPAASAVKTAILIELFAAHAGHLDEPLGTDAVLADDRHLALAPFSAAQRKEVRAGLWGASVRTVGAVMMGSHKASGTVYSAAANLAIASLGGPAETTARIAARDPRFTGVVIRRYMLAPRAPGDNLATPTALAAVLAAVATRELPGVDAATAAAIVQAMMQSTDPALGEHRSKEGDLDSDPMVVLKTGFYLRGGAGPPLVYVVAAVLTGAPTGTRDAAHRRLDQLTDAIHARLRAAAGR